MHSVILALLFNAMDIITGIACGIKEKDIQSSKLRDGLFKKVGFIFCYGLAYLIDNEGVYLGFTIGVDVLPIIVLYAVTTEIVSITENISILNPDLVPDKLLEMFHVKQLEEYREDNK